MIIYCFIFSSLEGFFRVSLTLSRFSDEPLLWVTVLSIYRQMNVLSFTWQKSCHVALYDRLSLIKTILLAQQVYRLASLWFKYVSGDAEVVNVTWALSYG